MKLLYPFIFILTFSPAFAASDSTRYVELLNFDWKFIQKNIPGAEDPDFNDADWETVHLPHDASIAGPFVKDSLNSDRKNGFLPRRKGWYRKRLEIDYGEVIHDVLA